MNVRFPWFLAAVFLPVLSCAAGAPGQNRPPSADAPAKVTRGTPTQTVNVSINGAQTNLECGGGTPTGGNAVYFTNIGSNALVTSLGGNGSFTAIAPSYRSEFRVAVRGANPSQAVYFTLTPGDNSPGVANFNVPPADLSDLGLPNIEAGPSGTISVEVCESFNDPEVNPDATVSIATITLGVRPQLPGTATLTNVVSEADQCGGVRYNATLTFTGGINDGGGNDTVWFTIFDDGVEKFAQSFQVPVGQTRAFAIAAEYPGVVGPIAPGIGVYVGESRGSGEFIVNDPFFPTPVAGCSIAGTPPAFAFVPAPGTPIPYPASGAGPSIAVSNGGGGTGSGAPATTTLTDCTITGGGAAFPTTAFQPSVSTEGTAPPNPSSFVLPNCAPQPTLTTASLSCSENRGPPGLGTQVQRMWTLTCPIGAGSAGPPVVTPPDIESESVNGGIADASSSRAVISRDALRMAFASDATNLVAGDSNGRADIFVRDRAAGTTARASAVADQLGPGQESYRDPAISSDGTTVAFTGSSGQIYASVNGLGRRISTNAIGTIGNGPSGASMIAAGGALVLFESQATNLLSSGVDGNGPVSDVFAKDLATGAVTLISRGPNGEPANGPSFAPWASADGQTVVFLSDATNVAVVANAAPKYLKGAMPRQAMLVANAGFGRNARYVSRNLATGALGNGDSGSVSLTSNGRYGVFESLASNLVSGDTNGVSDVFRFEVANDTVVLLQRVSETKLGVQGNGASRNPSISEDGLFITFETEATNLVSSDGNGAPDVLVKSVASGDITSMRTPAGAQPNGASMEPTISGNGSTIVFGSTATNLAPNDNNNAQDVFSSRLSTGGAADEPTITAFPLPVPTDFPNCPGGYFVAAIDDGPGAGLTSGAYGLNLVLNVPGTQRLEGGLNFGGLLDGSQVAFAGFNIQNSANEPQRLDVNLTGNPRSSVSGTLPVRIKLIRQPSPGVNELVFETVATLSLATPFVQTLTINPGFHVVTVGPEGTASTPGGAADGEVYVSLGSQFVNRPGGGFFGGVVVGGYHAAPLFGGSSGFASFCLGTPHATTAGVVSAPTYGANGARDLRLRLLDHVRRVVISAP